MHLRGVIPLLVFCFALQQADAERVLLDYKYFRRLSIDLVGRPPSRSELADFERPDFSPEKWIDQHLSGPAYAERLRRVYMDRLRLEVGSQFQFAPAAMLLRRVRISGPDGPTNVYYRVGQRRIPVEIDGDFCFTTAESGLKVAPFEEPSGTPTRVSRALFEARTVSVKPWWLYADYRSANPTDIVAQDSATRFPGYELVRGLLFEDDSKARAKEVRVCREEAQTAEAGRVYASGRRRARNAAPLRVDRATEPPFDDLIAISFQNRSVSCATTTGFYHSVQCGCGIGLERCLPSTNNRFESSAFILPTSAPLGVGSPFGQEGQPASSWLRLWWSEEAKHFLDRIFESDSDVRELLTSRATEVNGPLAHFYRFIANVTCCGPAAELGYLEPEALAEPKAIPTTLVPQDTSTWKLVADRGANAAGILTMPAFLAKYGSRRARAHALYTTFLCKEFVTPTASIGPSEELDLTKRTGCSTCHKTLDPLASYFARTNEADWTFWPAKYVPASMPSCAGVQKNSWPCSKLYEVALDGTMRGAHAAPANAELGPAGLASAITQSPDFAPCVVQNVTESFLGRSLTPDDAAWKAMLTKTFVNGGYRMRALVHAIVTSDRYRRGNDVRQ